MTIGPVRGAPTIVISDDFSDNSRTKTGASDLTWYLRNTGNTFSAESGTLVFNTSSSLDGYVGLFNSITLGEGDTLKFTLNYSYGSAPTGGASLLRFGVFNSGGTTSTQSADGTQAGIRNNDFGYSTYIDPNPSSLATAVTLKKENAGNDVLVGTVSTFSGQGTGINSGTSTHSLQFTLSRSSLGVTITSQLDSETAASSLDSGALSGAPFTTFDYLAFNFSDLSGSFTIDNVTAELTAVPEPSSFVLLGGGFMIAMMWLRNLRRAIASRV